MEGDSVLELPTVPFTKPRLGSALPSLDCSAPWLTQPPDRANLTGKPVVVHFFSSDCPLCDEGAHRIARWISSLAPMGLVVIGAFQPRHDTPASQAEALAECARHSRNAAHACVADCTGELAARFGNEWWPAYFVYDRAHRLRHYQMGNDGLDRLDALLNECVR